MRVLIPILISLVISSMAWADPGAGLFTNTKSNGSTTVVKTYGGTLVYEFTTAVDSRAFKVTSPRADLCFDSDRTSATLGAARVSVWYANDPTNAVTVSALNPEAITPDTNCTILIPGTYWIEVTTPRAAAEEPVVTITGRSN